MAQYPCDGHGGRYAGAQQTIYPALLDGDGATRRKLRLCPRCFEAMYEFLAINFVDATDDDPPFKGCPSCGETPGEHGVTMFATVYAKGQERQDLYGSGCREHKDALLEALRLN